MSKICFINGSPGGTQSASSLFISEVTKILSAKQNNHSFSTIQVIPKPNQNQKISFDPMNQADVWVFAFPLYYYALPGILVEFLEDYAQFAKKNPLSHRPRVYAIVNCGFPEPSHNDHAVKMIESFCTRFNGTWRLAVEVGTGPIVKGTPDMPMNGFLKAKIHQALVMLGEDIATSSTTPHKNLHVKSRIPNWLYLFMGNQNWKTMAKKGGLSEKDLAKAPYANIP